MRNLPSSCFASLINQPPMFTLAPDRFRTSMASSNGESLCDSASLMTTFVSNR